MAHGLSTILAATRQTVAARKRDGDRAALEREARQHTPRGFAAALREASTAGPAVLAELKKASPSKGLIRADFQPAALARSLAAAGAAALSVLTDEPFFQGSLAYLREARAAVGLPLLRKDFMVDPWQMPEARAAGADAVLLIVAAHTDADLTELAGAARDWELDILCEVHNAGELDRAASLTALAGAVFGVNCRDLKTLEVHPELHEALLAQMPADAVRVAESGLRGPEDLRRLHRAGYDAFLVGESLMRAADPGEALRQMLAPAGADVLAIQA